MSTSNRSLDEKYTDILKNAVENANQNEINIAILQNDLKHVGEEVTDIKEDLKTIKGYFVKVIIGIGSIVGLYFFQWILQGGLYHLVAANPPISIVTGTGN